MNSDEDLKSPGNSDDFTSSEESAALSAQIAAQRPTEPSKPASKMTGNPEAPMRLRTVEMEHIPRTPLKDKYEFLSVLGAGGAGVIYKAKQQPIGRLVAVKMTHI